jgi:predicted GH43/DUF377 family glycosyl hydrolase
MVKPSRPDLKVVGAFNPAAIRHEGEVILMLRVAEAPRVEDGMVAAPVYNADSGELEIKSWNRDAAGVNTTDPRVTVVEGHTWLTSISHYLFLADPRTRRIVGEPRADHRQQLRNLDRCGYAKLKEFDFPHKRAMLVMLLRERYFTDTLWWPRDDEAFLPSPSSSLTARS